MGKLDRGVSLVNFSLKHNLSLQKYFFIFWITFILAGVTASGWQQTSLTDTGATRRLVANQREVMTRLLELLYVLNIKRNIFYSVLPIPALWYFGTSVTYPPPPPPPPPPWFRKVKLVVIPTRFIYQQYLWNIAIQPAVGCYNSWANLQCWSCYPLGEKYGETSLLAFWQSRKILKNNRTEKIDLAIPTPDLNMS